jgi:conjugative transfer region protein TrbK
MRGRPFSMPVVGRLVGFALVAAAIVATAVHVRNGSGVAGPAVPPPADTLVAALARCQAMGVAAQDDGPCEAAWAENRRRFFGGRSSPGLAGAARAPTHLAKDR